jgi:hypothetical protein
MITLKSHEGGNLTECGLRKHFGHTKLGSHLNEKLNDGQD